MLCMFTRKKRKRRLTVTPLLDAGCVVPNASEFQNHTMLPDWSRATLGVFRWSTSKYRMRLAGT